jgi:hypothetical protein
VDAWNAVGTASEPVFRDFDRIDKDLAQLTDRVNAGQVPAPVALRTIANLEGECRSLETKISLLPAANDEIREVRKHLLAAQSYKLKILTKIEQILTNRRGARGANPRGLEELSRSYVGEFQAVVRLRDAYFQAHGMHPVDQAP